LLCVSWYALNVQRPVRLGVADALQVCQSEDVNVRLSLRAAVRHVAANVGEFENLVRGIEFQSKRLRPLRIVEIRQRNQQSTEVTEEARKSRGNEN
jgi:hypothetical protein